MENRQGVDYSANWTATGWDLEGAGLEDSIAEDWAHGKPVLNTEFGYQHEPVAADEFHNKTRQAHQPASVRKKAWKIATAGGFFAAGFQSTSVGAFSARDVDNFRPAQLEVLYDFFTTRTEYWRMAPHLESVASHNVLLALPGEEYVAYIPARRDELGRSGGWHVCGRVAARRDRAVRSPTGTERRRRRSGVHAAERHRRRLGAASQAKADALTQQVNMRDLQTIRKEPRTMQTVRVQTQVRRGFDQHPTGLRVAAFGNGTAIAFVGRLMGAGNQAEIGRRLRGRAEWLDVAPDPFDW